MEFLADVAVFLAKMLIVVFGIVLIIGAIARSARRGDGDESAGTLRVKKLNERWKKTALGMKYALVGKKRRKALSAEEKKRRTAEQNAVGEVQRPKVFVVDFDGNVRATQVTSLREEVSAILEVASPGDEVVVRLKSPGGLVYSYGLAACQLERVRERGVRLTAVVDQVAASGGYMMAVVADRIIAAPFAVIGSIGVVAGIPNLHRWLKKHDVDYELLTAGRHKRTLTVFGENTAEGRQKFQEELDSAHALFKAHVVKYRPSLDVDRVATGEHWYGQEALGLGLVDRVSTSDDYLRELGRSQDVYHVQWALKRRLGDRLGIAVEGAVGRVMDRLMATSDERRLP